MRLDESKSLYAQEKDAVRAIYGGEDVYRAKRIYTHDSYRVRKHYLTDLSSMHLYTENLDQAAVSRGLAYADGYLYINDNNGIFKINVSTMEQVGTPYTGGTYLLMQSLAALGGFLYAPDLDGDDLVKIDVSDMSYADSVTTTPGVKYSIDYCSQGYIYTGGYSSYASRVDPSSMTEVATFLHGGHVRIVVEDADGWLYSAGGDYVRKIDPSDFTAALDASDNPLFYSTTGYIAGAAAGGGHVFAAVGSSLRKLDPADMSYTGEYFASVDTIVSVLYGADGYLYLSDRGKRLFRVDPTDMTEDARYTDDRDLWSIAIQE